MRNIKQLQDELQRINDAAETAGWNDTLRVKSRDLREEIRDFTTQMQIEKMGAKGNTPHASSHNDVAAALIKSPEFSAWRTKVREDGLKDAGAIEVGMDFKDTDVTAVNADITEHWMPGMVSPVTVPMQVGNLFAQATMDGSSVSVLKAVQEAVGSASEVTGDADNTAIASQYAGPASFNVVGDQAFAKKVTASITVPEESLADLPALENELRSLLLNGPEGIAYKAEDQFLNGTGNNSSSTDAYFGGILDLSPDEATLGAGGYLSKHIFGAATELAINGLPADAVVLNPSDSFVLFTEEDSINRPLWGPFGSAYGGASGQGLPSDLALVKSYKCPVGTIIVGQFRSTTLFTRKAVSIRLSAEGIGLSDKGLILVVAQLRAAMFHMRGKSSYRTVTITS